MRECAKQDRVNAKLARAKRVKRIMKFQFVSWFAYVIISVWIQNDAKSVKS